MAIDPVGQNHVLLMPKVASKSPIHTRPSVQIETPASRRRFFGQTQAVLAYMKI